MANGHVFSDLVGEGRGKGATLIVAVLTLASGMGTATGYWASSQGLEAIDKLREERRGLIVELRTEIATMRADLRAADAEIEADLRALIDSEISDNQDTSNMRMDNINDRFVRIETILQQHVTRSEFEYLVRESGRRLDGLTAAVDWIRDRLSGRSPRDSQLQ